MITFLLNLTGCSSQKVIKEKEWVYVYPSEALLLSPCKYETASGLSLRDWAAVHVSNIECIKMFETTLSMIRLEKKEMVDKEGNK